MTVGHESKSGAMNARPSSSHSAVWKATLTVAVIIGIGRLILLLVAVAASPSISVFATLVTGAVIFAAAIVVPMQVMRARSAEQVARATQMNPDATVVAGIRSPIGKNDFDWIDKSFHPNLFYTVVASRTGVDIWQGGRNAKVALHIGPSQISSVGTTDLRLGSGRFPAVQIVFSRHLNVPDAVAAKYPTEFTAEFFVRRPSRPQRPLGLDQVNAAAIAITSALG
jgi:hypothetical protein